MRNYLQLIKALSFAALMLFSFGKVNATHIMGGDITYVCIGPNQYSIVAKLFKDCNASFTLPDLLNIDISSQNCSGSNQTVQLSNEGGLTNSFIAPFCNPGQDDVCYGGSSPYGVEQFFYRGTVTLPSCVNGDDFILTWSSCCRNLIITTGPASDGTFLYATLDNTLSTCNSSPAFNFEPTLYFCLGQENYFNNGVTDIDGDDLRFSLTPCLTNSQTDSVNYDPGFSSVQPLSNSSISIDPQTGQINIVPTALEIGVVCVKVEEFRSGMKISETIRDIQVAVLDCGTNDLPILSGLNGTASDLGATGSYSYTGCVGEEIELTINSYDAEAIPSLATQQLTMDWGIGITGASYIIDDTTSTLPTAKFRWTPTANDVGTSFFTVKIQDDACIFNGVSIFTYKIEVQQSGLNYSANIPNDTMFCDTSSMVIDVTKSNFGPGYQFFWSTNTSDSVLSCYNCIDPVFTPTQGFALPQESTTYEIYMVYKNLGATTLCTEKDTFRIDVKNCLIPDNTTSIDNLIRDIVVAPNPFSTNATLSYNLNQRSDVVIEVFDIVGQRVGTLANEKQPAGEHQLQLGEAINQVKGVYFVRLVIDGQVLTKKVLVQ